MHELSLKHAHRKILILIEEDAKGDNVKRQLFETISTHSYSHTHTARGINTNTSSGREP